jgi:DNA-binding NarL/FixJ family response regulator
MQKELNVIIVEDDPYARDFMSMLLRRDWRTRVVGEFSSLSGMELKQALHSAPPSAHVDILLLDTEVANDENWPAKVVQMTRVLPRPTLIVFTCISLEPRVKLEARLATMRQQRTELQSLLELAKSKEIVVKTIKSLDDLTGSGDTDISRIAQSIYARLDKATASTEIRAASLDEQIDQVLGRELINQQLAERKKKLAEKNA